MTSHATDELLRLALERAESLARPPKSTYRIQFHGKFTFADATTIIPYLAELGVTHIYASPYLAAVAGSTHGYDVIDHNRINPEIGSEKDYADFLSALKKEGLSHILDMVPNHMGVDTNDNQWWNSVLEHGRASPYAKFFDIDWRGSAISGLRDRVLLPILGEPYAKALEQGQLKLAYDSEKDCFVLNYFSRRIPLSPASCKEIQPAGPHIAQTLESFNGKPGDPHSFDRMVALLSSQNYRLAWWRVAHDEINYRRFFDINGLAALAMQRGEVFRTVHALALRLAAEGKIAGLRIDHPDGLYDPKKYFQRLQKYFVLACAKEIALRNPEYQHLNWKEAESALFKQLSKMEFPAGRTLPLYVVAEKILGFEEPLPTDWQCHGTSGYDFLAMVNELFVDASNQGAFTRMYQSITGQKEDFEELVYQKKRFILRQSLASDWQRLTKVLAHLARRDRRSHDFTIQSLHHAVGEIVACFPVYRSYIDSSEIRADDLSNWETATQRAIDCNPHAPPDIFHFLRDMILQRSPDSFTSHDRARQLRLAGKFQQLTSPIAAKGVEDTAFYIYLRLISINEVGGDPSRFGIDSGELHQYFSDRQRHWPYALNVLSTHDTKRSEDVRARLNVLSELPEDWEAHVLRWMKLNAPLRQMILRTPAPATDEEYLLYQTIVGAFPLAESSHEHETFVKRIKAYMQKAIREAKLRTSWQYPDEKWEKAVDAFVVAILDESKSSEFLANIAAFSKKVAHYGLINSLSQTLLRLAAPGVPDTYQGTELWDFSLVDPDNRRPVDYGHRRRLLETLKPINALNGSQRCQKVWQMMDQKEDARAKLWMTRQALHCRKKHPDLFTIGDYLPIEANGSLSRHVFAFARRHAEIRAIAVAPRFTARLAPGGGLPIGREIWGKTRLHLPDEFAGRIFENIYTGEQITPIMIDGVTQLLVSDVLLNFPVALLISDRKMANH